MSVYDQKAFSERVNFAVQHITRAGGESRHFDTCFEMFDGDAVVVALVRRAAKNSKLASRLYLYIGRESSAKAVEAMRDIPTRKLADEAERMRRETSVALGMESEDAK